VLRAWLHRCEILLLAASLTLLSFAPQPARADVDLSGDADLITIRVHDASLKEVLTALRDEYGLHYPDRVGFDQSVEGTFQGDLYDVLSELLENYDYVATRSGTGEPEVTFARLRVSGRQAARTIRGADSGQVAALAARFAHVRPPWRRAVLARLKEHGPSHALKAIRALSRRAGCFGPTAACAHAPARIAR
jgi:hypothetical protein